MSAEGRAPYRREPHPRLLRVLERIVDNGLMALLVFTPLAFGSVEPWAQAVAEIAIALVGGAWVLSLVWSRPPDGAGSGPGALFSGRVRLSGLEWPALAFVLVVAFQLVPLPASWVRTISPRTAEIYRDSLPGYGHSETLAELPRWLQEDPAPQAGGVPALPPDPDAVTRAVPEEVFDLPQSEWRTISLTPAYTRRALEVFIAHLVVFFVAYQRFGMRERALRYCLVLAGMTGLLAALGLAQDLTDTTRVYWWRPSSGTSPFGPFVSNNNFAGWMEMGLPVSLGLAAWLWIRHRSRQDHADRLVIQVGRSFSALVFVTLFAVFGLTAFLFARSRGGLLALAAALVLFAVVHAGRGRLRAPVVLALISIVLVVAVIGVWVGGSDLLDRYATLARPGDEPSFRFRLAAAGQTLRMAKDFPVLGTGLGTFEEAFYLYSPGTSFKVLRRSHNDYAQLVAECGLLGGVVFAWALGVLIVRGLAPALRRDGGAFRWPVRGAAVAVLALLFHSFVDFNLQIYSNSLLFVFLCALLMRDARDRGRGRASTV